MTRSALVAVVCLLATLLAASVAGAAPRGRRGPARAAARISPARARTLIAQMRRASQDLRRLSATPTPARIKSAEDRAAFDRDRRKLAGMAAEWDAHVALLEGRLATLGDDAQLANIDLQSALQKQQQTLQTLSNVSKVLHDTAMAVIRKIG